MVEDTWIGCTPDGKPPVVGTEYRILHSRKGKFFGRVISTDEDTWATVEITSGAANAMLAENVRLEGERVTVRSSLCRMDPTVATAAEPGAGDW